MLLHRRLFDSRIRKTSSFSDIAVLLMLFVQLSLGLLTIPLSLGHLDGGMMVQFMNYVQGIVTLKPGSAALIADVPLIFKLHMFLGFTIFLIFPFTRLVHVWSAPVGYLFRNYQIVRTRARRAAPCGMTTCRHMSLVQRSIRSPCHPRDAERRPDP